MVTLILQIFGIALIAYAAYAIFYVLTEIGKDDDNIFKDLD